MKVHVPSIPEEGKSFPLADSVPWVRQLLEERMGDYWRPGSPVSGELRLWRTHANVTLHGHWELSLVFTCDRCAATYSTVLSIPLNRHLTPFFDDPRDRSSEERELSEEDLEFSTYHGDEMDLLEILSEEFFLALPMGSYCREECLGLCLRCGTDLNTKPCSCSQEVSDESPFAILKNWRQPR